MKRFTIFLSILSICAIFVISCSEDELGDFQQNDPEPDFRLFTLLDDYPALRSAWDPVDPYLFNDLLCDAMNDYPNEVKSILGLVDDLLIEKRTDAFVSVKHILNQIINQDELDIDPPSKYCDSDYATKDFPYYDLIKDNIDPDTNEKLNLTKPILALVRKILGYIKYKYQGDELEEIMADLINFLKDNNGTSVGSTVRLLSEILGKIYF